MTNNTISRLYKYLVKVFGFKGDTLVEKGRLSLTFEGDKVDVGPLAVGEEALTVRAIAALPVQWTNELDD